MRLQIHERKDAWDSSREFTISVIYVLSLQRDTIFKLLRSTVRTFSYASAVFPSTWSSFIIYSSFTIFSLCKSFNCLTHIAIVRRAVRFKHAWKTSNIWHSPSFVCVIAESKPWYFWVSTCTKYDHPIHSIKCPTTKSYGVKHQCSCIT